MTRLMDGSRKIVQISEITGMRSDGSVEMVDLFRFVQKSIEKGKVIGNFVATGVFPSFIDEAKTHGISVDKGIFGEGELKED